MLKKTVTYEDYNGVERTDTLRFNLSRTELLKLSMELPDGLIETVQNGQGENNDEEVAVKLVEKLGGDGVLDFIEKLVLKSYGVLHEDGIHFEKSEELSKKFSQTLAFDAIMMEFMTDSDAAAEFVNKIVPAQVLAQMNNAPAKLPVNPTN